MEVVKIKLLENPDNPQLKMKYVGAVDYATPKVARDGKIITGLDDMALSIISMQDGQAKKKLQSEIKKEREELEKVLGVDLSTTSTFWDEFFIPLSDEEITLDPLNPMDRLKERYLIANKYVAPSKDAIENDEDYQGCIFYLYREKEEMVRTAQRQKLVDKAKAKLFNLNEENPNKLKIVASYLLGFSLQKELAPEEAYVKINDFIDNKNLSSDERRKHVTMFLEAVEKSPEELSVKLILDKAVSKRIVTKKNNVYRRGDIILGNNYEQALSYLSSIENSGEFYSLQKQVDEIK